MTICLVVGLEMAIHGSIVEMFFGQSSNEQVGRYLVGLGWIYTICVSILTVTKLAAPYGKHLNENTPFAAMWNGEFDPEKW